MRTTNGSRGRGAVAIVAGAALTTLGVLHPWWATAAMAILVGSLLVPPTLLALLLRVVKVRDRHASFRLARPLSGQAFPPAAFGNSSGGRNVS